MKIFYNREESIYIYCKYEFLVMSNVVNNATQNFLYSKFIFKVSSNTIFCFDFMSFLYCGRNIFLFRFCILHCVSKNKIPYLLRHWFHKTLLIESGLDPAKTVKLFGGTW